VAPLDQYGHMGLGFVYPSRQERKGQWDTVAEGQLCCTDRGARAWSENGTEHGLGDAFIKDLELARVFS